MSNPRIIANVWVDDGTGENVQMEIADTTFHVGDNIAEKVMGRIEGQRDTVGHGRAVLAKGVRENDWCWTVFNAARVVAVQEAQE